MNKAKLTAGLRAEYERQRDDVGIAPDIRAYAARRLEADDSSEHKHLKRCDAAPFGSPCVCPNAPHTLRFLGENMTLSRMQWEVLNDQMLEDAPDRARIVAMLNEPLRSRPLISSEMRDMPIKSPATTGDSITPEQHVGALTMGFDPSGDEADTPASTGDLPCVPDVLYAVSAAVIRHRQLDGSSEHWRVDCPTFYLDSRVQGIKSERHAREIVEHMLHAIGHDHADIMVYATATLAPVHDRQDPST